MTKTTRSISVSKPKSAVWNFLNDVTRVGGCLPGCQDVRILDDTRSIWKVKVTTGILSRIFETYVTKVIEQQLERISFQIKTTNGDIEGKLDLILADFLQNQTNSTTIRVDLDLKASGSFSWVVNQMIGKQSDKMIELFVACLEKSA